MPKSKCKRPCEEVDDRKYCETEMQKSVHYPHRWNSSRTIHLHLGSVRSQGLVSSITQNKGQTE